jgi:hypothetical protein
MSTDPTDTVEDEPTRDELVAAARELLAQEEAETAAAQRGTDLAAAIDAANSGAPIVTSAVEAEAAGVETVDIVWRDVTLTVPANVDDWPIDAVEAFENGKQLAFARALLSFDGYQDLKRVAPTVRDFKAFMDLMAERLGFADLGNS